jgi:hypothetical protein
MCKSFQLLSRTKYDRLPATVVGSPVATAVRNATGLTLMCGSAFAQNTGAPANAQSGMNKPMNNSMEKDPWIGIL